MRNVNNLFNKTQYKILIYVFLLQLLHFPASFVDFSFLSAQAIFGDERKKRGKVISLNKKPKKKEEKEENNSPMCKHVLNAQVVDC